MRTHGKITRWNDDRGFGFVRSTGAEADVFVHVSDLPRDGIRPRLDELISFEVESGPDGRQRAVRVMRAAQRAAPRRTMCSQMGSCEEAQYFIRNCPATQMDGDGDGIPCESQWCG